SALPGRERTAGDLDQRLRQAAGEVAEALGFAARQDDGFHYSASSGSRSAVSGSAASGDEARPIPSYVKPAARAASGSSRLRPSTIRGRSIASRVSSERIERNSPHSVTITAASAPCIASLALAQSVTPCRRSPGPANGSYARTSAPSASSRDASTTDGASRMSAVFA